LDKNFINNNVDQQVNNVYRNHRGEFFNNYYDESKKFNNDDNNIFIKSYVNICKNIRKFENKNEIILNDRKVLVTENYRATFFFIKGVWYYKKWKKNYSE